MTLIGESAVLSWEGRKFGDQCPKVWFRKEGNTTVVGEARRHVNAKWGSITCRACWLEGPWSTTGRNCS